GSTWPSQYLVIPVRWQTCRERLHGRLYLLALLLGKSLERSLRSLQRRRTRSRQARPSPFGRRHGALGQIQGRELRPSPCRWNTQRQGQRWKLVDACFSRCLTRIVPNNCVFKGVFFGPNKITFLRRTQKRAGHGDEFSHATGQDKLIN